MLEHSGRLFELLLGTGLEARVSARENEGARAELSGLACEAQRDEGAPRAERLPSVPLHAEGLPEELAGALGVALANDLIRALEMLVRSPKLLFHAVSRTLSQSRWGSDAKARRDGQESPEPPDSHYVSHHPFLLVDELDRMQPTSIVIQQPRHHRESRSHASATLSSIIAIDFIAIP
jgi:hypothetical protein